ncbi:hypothetical protein [Benzoatithermus flavus]|uniref:Uncharacterized protein n=1 Tax=Benzoatithermus flavus TaxID=3108223 RepID=A0ABU8XR40_9PROT
MIRTKITAKGVFREEPLTLPPVADENVSLDLPGKRTFEILERLDQIRNDRTVMGHMLQRHDAAHGFLRDLDRNYEKVRLKIQQIEKRLEKAGL